MKILQKWITIIVLILVISAVGLYLTLGNQTKTSSYVQPEVQNNEHTITLTNRSEYTISPGVLVIHSRASILNFLAERASHALEHLAELGEPEELITTLKQQDYIYTVQKVKEIPSGEEVTITVEEENLDAKISYMGMIQETNDALVWVNSLGIFTGDGRKQARQTSAEILDAGTEANAPIGTGFSGGQPDVSRGRENEENGIPTDETIRHHAQFYNDPTKATEFFFLSIQ